MWRIGLVLCTALVTFLPGAAEAQSIGIGPRLTFISGDDTPDDESTRHIGAGLRLGGGKVALELSIDYRKQTDELLGVEIKDYPFQASILYFPVRKRLAPYLMGGAGWFTRRVTPTGGLNLVTEELSNTDIGYHAGAGLELKLGRRFGVYGDYRYTFLDFNGDDEVDGEASAPRFIPFAGRLGISNEGSMWSWGVNFYF